MPAAPPELDEDLPTNATMIDQFNATMSDYWSKVCDRPPPPFAFRQAVVKEALLVLRRAPLLHSSYAKLMVEMSGGARILDGPRISDIRSAHSSAHRPMSNHGYMSCTCGQACSMVLP